MQSENNTEHEWETEHPTSEVDQLESNCHISFQVDTNRIDPHRFLVLKEPSNEHAHNVDLQSQISVCANWLSKDCGCWKSSPDSEWVANRTSTSRSLVWTEF